MFDLIRVHPLGIPFMSRRWAIEKMVAGSSLQLPPRDRGLAMLFLSGLAMF